MSLGPCCEVSVCGGCCLNCGCEGSSEIDFYEFKKEFYVFIVECLRQRDSLLNSYRFSDLDFLEQNEDFFADRLRLIRNGYEDPSFLDRHGHQVGDCCLCADCIHTVIADVVSVVGRSFDSNVGSIHFCLYLPARGYRASQEEGGCRRYKSLRIHSRSHCRVTCDGLWGYRPARCGHSNKEENEQEHADNSSGLQLNFKYDVTGFQVKVSDSLGEGLQSFVCLCDQESYCVCVTFDLVVPLNLSQPFC